MAVQMYLVQPKESNEAVREEIAEHIAYIQGFILMATSYGSLIVAFDEQYLDAIKRNRLVEFVGGVTFNPDGPAAAQLQQLFAQNVALQLQARQSEATGSAFPPGYRPLNWSRVVETEKGGG
jgi:hypothetical protein